MIKSSDLENYKIFAEMQVNLIHGGVIYLIIEGDSIVWKTASRSFDLSVFDVGSKLPSQAATFIAMKEKKTVIQKIPRSLYGVRLTVTSSPIIDDKCKVIGAVSVVFPNLHPVAAAFNSIGPVLADMFPEGAFIYMTDLNRIAYRQASSKFDIPSMQAGYELKENDISSKVIKTKQHLIAEFDASIWGVPVVFITYPIFDEENKNELVATFGIVLPKSNAVRLREMSYNISENINGISAAVEQLAASASEIHTDEIKLNSSILEINNLSEEINSVSLLIKEIAEQTNMLGLNASIEAARAGNFGGGFNVIAKEIRKLSEQSKNAVPKIKELTDKIKEKVNLSSNQSESVLSSSEEQASASEEISASIEEISALIEELDKMAQNM